MVSRLLLVFFQSGCHRRVTSSWALIWLFSHMTSQQEVWVSTQTWWAAGQEQLVLVGGVTSLGLDWCGQRVSAARLVLQQEALGALHSVLQAHNTGNSFTRLQSRQWSTIRRSFGEKLQDVTSVATCWLITHLHQHGHRHGPHSSWNWCDESCLLIGWSVVDISDHPLPARLGLIWHTQNQQPWQQPVNVMWWMWVAGCALIQGLYPPRCVLYRLLVWFYQFNRNDSCYFALHFTATAFFF